MRALLFIAALAIAAPAMAQTAPQPAPAPVKDAAKTDKPFVYDSLRRQLPRTPAPKTPAGPGVG